MISNSILTFATGVLLYCISPKIPAQSNHNPYRIDTINYKYAKICGKSFLVLPDRKRIKIPETWLYPPQEVEKDQDSYVNSFNYLEYVTSFTVSKNLVGLHVASWDYMPPGSGSAMAASGRDVFLIYSTNTHKLIPGILDLGITKDRLRSMGCFFASFNKFYLGDVNHDSLTDIGVELEKIWCEEVPDKNNQMSHMSEPYYKKYPIEWLILKEGNWKMATQYRGFLIKEKTSELPMIGLTKNPVEFIREIYQREHINLK
jgi:hypothetical protein